MKSYEKYKSTGISWLPQVPEHWDTQPLRHLLKAICLKNQPELPLLSVERERGVVIRDVDNKKSNHNFVPEDLSGYKVVCNGQFVINKMKAWQGSYGLSNYNGLVSPAYYVFDLNLADKVFFSKAIRSKFYVPFFTRASDGIRVGQWDLAISRMKDINFFIPTIEESNKICKYLDWKTADIARLIVAKKKQINLLDEQKRTIINQAVTKGLDPASEFKDSGIPWLGQVPVSWSANKLAAVFFENKNVNSNFACAIAMRFNYGQLTPKYSFDIDRKLTETYSKYTLIKKNDIVVNGLNLNYDFVTQRVAIVENDGIITSSYIIMTPRKTISPKYFWYYLKSLDNRKLLNGMGTGLRLTLTFKELKTLLLYYPELNEQKQIAAFLDKKTEAISKAIEKMKQEITLLQEYRTRLISDAVTGQIDLRDVIIPENIITIKDEDNEEENEETEVEENDD